MALVNWNIILSNRSMPFQMAHKVGSYLKPCWARTSRLWWAASHSFVLNWAWLAFHWGWLTRSMTTLASKFCEWSCDLCWVLKPWKPIPNQFFTGIHPLKLRAALLSTLSFYMGESRICYGGHEPVLKVLVEVEGLLIKKCVFHPFPDPLAHESPHHFPYWTQFISDNTWRSHQILHEWTTLSSEALSICPSKPMQCVVFPSANFGRPNSYQPPLACWLHILGKIPYTIKLKTRQVTWMDLPAIMLNDRLMKFFASLPLMGH
jgi:hypothetical protein